MEMTSLTDVHCHLLPYVDDGAQNLEEAAALLRLQVEQGVGAIYLTPHLRAGMFETPQEKIEEQYHRLCELAGQIPGGPRLFLGREYYCDEQFSRLLAAGQVQPLGSSNCLLIEFSARHTARDLFAYTARVQRQGYQPLLAHVERYPCLYEDPGLAPALVEEGAWLQMNAGSLLGRDGLRQKLFCRRLVKTGLIRLLASDAHRTEVRTPNLGDCARFVKKHLDDALAEQLLYRNPQLLATPE